MVDTWAALTKVSAAPGDFCFLVRGGCMKLWGSELTKLFAKPFTLPILSLFLFYGLNAAPALAADITFDYESGVTGFGTKDARQTLSGETLKAVAVSDVL